MDTGLSSNLALSLAGLERGEGLPWSAGARSALDWAGSLVGQTRSGPGVGRTSALRYLRIDATMTGLRPRELDRSARRDLSSVLRRSSLLFGGLDLFVPPTHFTNATHSDRAAEAVLASIELAADLAALSAGASAGTTLGAEADAGRVVAVELPREVPASMLEEFDRHAQSRGVRLADHAVVVPEVVSDAVSGVEDKTGGARGGRPASLGVGVDPAALFAAGLDPMRYVAGAGRLGIGGGGVVSARLSDLSSRGRIPAGSAGGRLDVMAYVATLSAVGFHGPMVIDLRGLSGQAEAAVKIVGAMEGVMTHGAGGPGAERSV